jgi:hypothetical protein
MFALWMRRLLGPCVTVALMAPLPLWGQDQPEIGDVASALAAERARIAELQSELEHRSAALAKLARRLEAIAPASVSTQAPAAAPAERTAAAVPPPRFDFYGESKVRYETLQQDYPGCEGCPNRQRGRLRLRFGVGTRLSGRRRIRRG